MFSRYFQGELAFLRGMGKAYAEANPTTAGMLAERGGDPDVERLLEGFAFLAARVRERLEDAVPEVVHDLSELLLPHFLRPLPASSIVEMLPPPGALRERLRVPAGAEIASGPIEGTACRFRTTADLDVVPATVHDVALDQSIGATPVLRLQLRISPQAVASVFQPGGLRLFVHGEYPLASALLLWFARHLRGLRLKGLASGRIASLPPGKVTLPGLGPELPLLPWPSFAPRGYRLLQEFFTLPQKLLFVHVGDLHEVRELAEERVEIAFEFERPPDLPIPVSKDLLRTNCVPVVNLFRTAAEPVAVKAIGEEHLLRAAELPPDHMAIHSVEAVVGIPEGPGERVAYEPFSSFRHAAQGREGHYFRLRRSLSPIDEEVDTWIGVARPLDAGAAGRPETLSVEVTATNRGLPARLEIGDLSRATATSPTQVRFRNVVPVSRPVRPPLGTELHWRLVAHLAANRTSLASATAVQSLLGVYNLQGLADQQVGRANALRIEAVRQVEVAPARRLVGGTPVHGTRVVMDLDERGFASPGDAFLFSSALDDLLAEQCSLSSFAELAVRLQPTQREYAWPPRNGKRTLV